MKSNDSSVSLKSTRFLAPGMFPAIEGEAPATERQERVPGFNQAKLHELQVALIGAGGIGSEIGLGLVRKGVGSLHIFDEDVVALSNLNRQRFFSEDLYKNKAECLARNLARESISRSVITAYPYRFQDALENGFRHKCGVIVCGVDNNVARVAVARYASNNISTIGSVFVAVSEDTEHGYVFVQEPGKGCFGCAFPKAINDITEHPCSPAVVDILKVVSGIALYAIDSIIMARKRTWNYKEIFLSGIVPERNSIMDRRVDCSICGTSQKEKLFR
jgi:molybdopterin/thiamine biosynthesis adenylyltransferase